MTDGKVRVDAVMGEIERDVRARLRRHLIKKGGAADYQDEAIFDAVHVVLSRAVDGHMRAYSTKDGSILWDFNTVRDYETVNHVPGKGGSIDAAGPAIADGLLITNSGYALWRGLPGNVLLAFSAR